MALHQTPRTRLIYSLVLVTALLALFGIASIHLTRESLWDDEGYTMWFIRDSAATPESLSENIRFVRDSVLNTLARVRVSDVHPPLYYLSLDVWSLAVGQSVYAVRLYSVLCGLVALAATYAVGRRLFRDFAPALLAVLILGTASFFVYYTREARMYMLLLALTALVMWAYIGWARKPTLRRGVVYAVLLAALVYTHYVGVLVIFTQMLHQLIWGKRNARLFLPYIGAAVLFAPWLPSALAQYRALGGPGALPLPTNLNTIAALLLILTNGSGWLYAALVVSGYIRPPVNRWSLALVTLWLLVLPVTLLLLNAAVRPLFQIRYVISILPAFALIVALGFKNLFALRLLVTYPLLRLVLPALLIYLQLATYSWFWPNKPDWETAVGRMTETRTLLEPAITSIAAYSPVAYYDRQYHIREGISLDLAWRWQESYQMQDYVEQMGDAPSVWVVMPSSFASTWDAVTALQANDRTVGYRDTLMNMIFYRFDRADNSDADLQFRFGDAFAWQGGLGNQLYARAGEPFCVHLSFQALEPSDAGYTVDVALTQGYDTRRAGVELTLDAYTANQDVELSPCIDVQADNPAGPHHLRVRVLHNGMPLNLLESDHLYWGDTLMPALVSVE